MNVSELSNEFDVLYNNVMSNQAPGLTEYEKSVFLTKAQDEIVKSYFNPRLNKTQEGFDGTERRQIDFSMLMRTVSGTKVTGTLNLHSGVNVGYYAMPKDILLYINESLIVERGGSSCYLTIVPLNYTEYSRLMSKPFKRPVKSQAWRLISSGKGVSYKFTDYAEIAKLIYDGSSNESSVDAVYSLIIEKRIKIDEGKAAVTADGYYLAVSGKGLFYLSSNSSDAFVFDQSTLNDIDNNINKTVSESTTVVEIIPGNNDTIKSYIIRYVARPRPIILDDLTNEGVSIEGEEQAHGCELDPILHHEILQRAVELAKAAYQGDISTTLAVGMQSATDKGIIPQSR